MSRGTQPASGQIVCQCGKRLKLSGALPGRVGRCPFCGATFRVPERSPNPPPTRPSAPPATPSPQSTTTDSDESNCRDGYALAPSTAVAPSRPGRAAPAERLPEREPAPGTGRPRPKVEPVGREGLVARPSSLEDRVRVSLRYPLWDAPGLSLLVVLPPVLWLTSLFSVGLIPTYVLGDQDLPTRMGALTMVVPMLALLALVLGYALRFIGEVLVSSAQGDVFHPRLPGFELGAVFGAWVRWLASALGGALIAGPPAFLDVFARGVHDGTDWLVLAVFGSLGMACALIAAMAVWLHESLAAASPTTVLSALARCGGDALRLALFAAVLAGLTIAAAAALLRFGGVVAGTVGLWAFWAAFLYESMVMARVLGRFYRRHAKSLKWFRESR